jgi:hypothetical protein
MAVILMMAATGFHKKAKIQIPSSALWMMIQNLMFHLSNPPRLPLHMVQLRRNRTSIHLFPTYQEETDSIPTPSPSRSQRRVELWHLL